MTHRIWLWRTKCSPCTSLLHSFSQAARQKVALCWCAIELSQQTSQSVSKSNSPCQKTKCACALCIGSTFTKCHKSMVSLKEVVETPQCKLYLLSRSAASGPSTLAAACASETFVLNFIALLPDGVAVFCVVWQCFFWLVMILNKGNVKKVHIFHLLFFSMCIFLK